MSVWDPPSPPVITSASTASGVVGTALQYAITATNLPKTYAANDLPSGLFIDVLNGKIFGIPTTAGVYNITMSAINLGGAGTGILTLTVT